MVLLDSEKLVECVEWSTATDKRVTLKVDGEQLKKAIYDDIKIELADPDSIKPLLRCQDAPFIEFYPNELFDAEDCNQIAIEIMNRINSQIKAKLNIE